MVESPWERERLRVKAYFEVSGDHTRPSHLQVAICLAIMRQHSAAVIYNAHVYKDWRSPLHMILSIAATEAPKML